MQFVVDRRRRKVLFDDKRKVYIKILIPRFLIRLKCFLGLRKYPGDNTKYIGELLNSGGINTPKILHYERYKIEMSEIEGRNLEDIIKNSNEIDARRVMAEYIKVLATIVKMKIYAPDATLDNFIMDKTGTIFVIDFEGYEKQLFINKARLLSKFKKKFRAYQDYQLKTNFNLYDELKKEIYS